MAANNTARSVALKLAGLGVGLFVTVFVVIHLIDSHRAEQLEQLHGAIARDTVARKAAEERTDTAVTATKSAAAAVAHADSSWAHITSRAGTQVAAIVASPVHDTLKIKELVYVVDTLREQGDSLERAADADTLAAHELRVTLLAERAAWTQQSDDYAAALKKAEAQIRHWGLGCSGGPSIVSSAGVARTGLLGATCGITWRW